MHIQFDVKCYIFTRILIADSEYQRMSHFTVYDNCSCSRKASSFVLNAIVSSTQFNGVSAIVIEDLGRVVASVVDDCSQQASSREISGRG